MVARFLRLLAGGLFQTIFSSWTDFVFEKNGENIMQYFEYLQTFDKQAKIELGESYL
jgi:hypothetical protein